MLILAVDTTSDCGGAAVFRDGECLATAASQGFTNYAVGLFEVVDEALGDARVDLNEIELFAAASGPGSFTGIRVGLAAIQGWAAAFRRPAIGVSTLEAVAEEGQAPLTLPLLDARRGEFYARMFRRPQSAARLIPQGDAAILKPASVMPFLEAHASGDVCRIAARENDALAAELLRSLSSSVPHTTVSGFLFPAIAAIALRAITDGQPRSDLDVYGCYIRRPDAEVKWKA